MSSLRDQITRTLLRISKGSRSRPTNHSGDLAAPDLEGRNEANYEGRQLGSYKIIRRLGVGGMGHVYLAYDTRLGRHVALKFLSPDLLADPGMLERLQSEARAASSLNHPNILTIYEVGAAEGEHFIASEYVEGATLRLAMERHAVNLSTALDIVTQVASALVAAHAAGIVHRDLKPGNIMIREDGYVKVIDFGLAKRLRRVPRSRGKQIDLTMTRPGTVVGTVHYMSPEQANGSAVDGRADLWSLGVILYELVSHRLPFDGDTEDQVLDGIRDRPVPELPASVALPPGLADVIRRALSKTPATRFQNAREMLSALSEIHRPDRHSTPRPFRLRRSRGPWRSVAAAVGTATLIAILWHFGLREVLFGPHWFQIDKVRQVTFNGQVTIACISPDGKYLAYVAGDPQGMQTLYLSQLNTATEQVKIPSRKVTYYGVRFSPDNEIYATSEESDLMGKLYVVPIVGEASERPILTDIDGPVTFSPAGDRFAFVRYSPRKEAGHDVTEHSIYVAAKDGSNPVRIFSTSDANVTYQIAWSPSEDRIAAFLKGYSGAISGKEVLHLIGLHGEDSTIALPDWQIVGQPWWADNGRSLLLTAVARTESTTQAQLRQVDVRTGKVLTISRDLASYKSASLTRDGKELAVVKTESRANLWLSGANDFVHGQSSSAEAVTFPTLSWPDEGHLLVDSQRGGFQNLWFLAADGFARKRLTSEPFVQQEAVPIPGTHSVVMASNRSGQFKLWRFDEDTGQYSQLTFGPTYDQSPTVSPDGQWIVYTSWYSSSSRLRKVRTSGGAAVSFTDLNARDPRFSPDGKSVAAYVEVPPRSLVEVLAFPEPASPRPVKQVYVPFEWVPDGSGLTSVQTNGRGVSNVVLSPLDGSKQRQLTAFDDQRILKFAWSPTGDRLACIRTVFGADVALFTRSR